ncbi:MAG: hypothetical protein AAF211_05005 [Myxococcota bacterium]
MRLWTLTILLVACEGNGGFTLVRPNPDNVGDTAAPDGATACNQIESQGLCTDFVGSSYSTVEVQGNCAGGEVVESCPGSDVLGICGLQVGTVFETQTSYYLGTFYDATNIAGAESQCTLTGGEWL